MYRDPDPAHHKLFYKALEETGQHELANTLRSFVNEEAETVAKKRGHKTNENRIALANPDKLTDDKIMKQLKKQKSPVYVAIGFAFTGMIGTLQDVDLNNLLVVLQEETVVELSEFIELRNYLKDQDTGKTDCLYHLTKLLQMKTKEELITFLGLLDRFPGTSDLVRWIKIIVEKCESVSSSMSSVESCQHEEKAILVLPVEITTQSHGIKTSDQQIVDILNRELPGLQTRVLCVEGKEVSVKKKCIQISLALEDEWDLENLQKSIECGLFTQRLRSWLKQKKYVIKEGTQFETTLRMTGQSDEDMSGKPVAHYMEKVLAEVKGTSGEDEALLQNQCSDVESLQTAHQKEPQTEVTAVSGTGEQGIISLPDTSDSSSGSLQSSHEMALWQTALVNNIFFITEKLECVDILQSQLAAQLDEEIKGILKKLPFDEVKVFILLKYAIHRSIHGYKIFCQFLKETGQFDIRKKLISIPCGDAISLEEQPSCMITPCSSDEVPIILRKKYKPLSIPMAAMNDI